ncbi:hypothetical protein [Enterococcus avium]|nr:hypothetical protein [Enterococcus avium]
MVSRKLLFKQLITGEVDGNIIYFCESRDTVPMKRLINVEG